MAIDIIRPEFVQNLPQLIQLGVLAFGVMVHCNSCNKAYDNAKNGHCPDPDCGDTYTKEGLKKQMQKLHQRVAEIFGEEGMPSCGGSANNDEGGGGAPTFLTNLFRGNTKKPK